MADAADVYRDRPTEAEIADVLSQRLVATIDTVNPDGSVHLAYVIFDHHGGRIYVETSSLTRTPATILDRDGPARAHPERAQRAVRGDLARRRLGTPGRGVRAGPTAPGTDRA